MPITDLDLHICCDRAGGQPNFLALLGQGGDPDSHEHRGVPAMPATAFSRSSRPVRRLFSVPPGVSMSL